jgi:hypothetical protein
MSNMDIVCHITNSDNIDFANDEVSDGILAPSLASDRAPDLSLIEFRGGMPSSSALTAGAAHRSTLQLLQLLPLPLSDARGGERPSEHDREEDSSVVSTIAEGDTELRAFAGSEALGPSSAKRARFDRPNARAINLGRLPPKFPVGPGGFFHLGKRLDSEAYRPLLAMQAHSTTLRRRWHKLNKAAVEFVAYSEAQVILEVLMNGERARVLSTWPFEGAKSFLEVAGPIDLVGWCSRHRGYRSIVSADRK